MTAPPARLLEVKSRKAMLKHPANAHTGGDTYVYFEDANVLSTGDTFTNGRCSTQHHRAPQCGRLYGEYYRQYEPRFRRNDR